MFSRVEFRSRGGDTHFESSPIWRSTHITCRRVEAIRKFPEFFLWLIFTYLALLFLWFIFTIVEPEKWEGQNGQPKEENLRC